MIRLKPRVFAPRPAAHAVYREIYPLYRVLHDAFGTNQWHGSLHHVMKQLLDIRSQARA